jgi:hypothetical protein
MDLGDLHVVRLHYSPDNLIVFSVRREKNNLFRFKTMPALALVGLLSAAKRSAGAGLRIRPALR